MEGYGGRDMSQGLSMYLNATLIIAESIKNRISNGSTPCIKTNQNLSIYSTVIHRHSRTQSKSIRAVGRSELERWTNMCHTLDTMLNCCRHISNAACGPPLPWRRCSLREPNSTSTIRCADWKCDSGWMNLRYNLFLIQFSPFQGTGLEVLIFCAFSATFFLAACTVSLCRRPRDLQMPVNNVISETISNGDQSSLQVGGAFVG